MSCPEIGLHIKVNKNQDYGTVSKQVHGRYKFLYPSLLKQGSLLTYWILFFICPFALMQKDGTCLAGRQEIKADFIFLYISLIILTPP